MNDAATVLQERNKRSVQSRGSRSRLSGGTWVVRGNRRFRPGTLSACLIVKDEERMLPGCLESLRGVVDDIVVVDTGSTDATVAIARRQGARVFAFPWSGDFAAARNVSLERATGEWILVLDADERLAPAGPGPVPRALLFRALDGGGSDAYALHLVNYDDMRGKVVLDEHYCTRVVRNDPRLCYRNRVHETLVLPSGTNIPVLGDFVLRHFGYVQAVIREKDKIERNRSLLQAELEASPESSAMHFYLAREYHRMGDLESAAGEYRRAWELLGEARPQYWAELAAFLARTLVATRQADEAVAHCDAVLADWPHFSDLWAHRGQALRLRGDMQGALASLYKALATHETNPLIPLHQKVLPGLCWADIGLCYQDTGDLARAAAAYRESLRVWPRLGHVAQYLGTLLLPRGESPEAFERAVLEAAGDDEPVVWEDLWHAFATAGRWEHALRWADRVIAAEPTADRYRRRAHAQLHLGRHAACLADLDELERLSGPGEPAADDPWVRTLALLASGRDEEAAAVLEAMEPANRLVRAARRLAARRGDAAPHAGMPDPSAPAAGGPAAAPASPRAVPDPDRSAGGGPTEGARDLVAGLWELAGQLAGAHGFAALQSLASLLAELGEPADLVQRNMLRLLQARGLLHTPPGGPDRD